MGDKKTRFMRGDAYGLHVVTHEACQLVRGFHDRKPAVSSLSTEAVDVPSWDDLLTRSPGLRHHWQAKNQITDLAEDEFLSIVTGMKACAAAAGSMPQFHLGLRRLGSVAKTKANPALDLANLQDLCKEAAQPGVLDPALFMSNLVAKHRKWVDYFESALGTKDPQILHEYFAHLELVELGDDVKIRQRSVDAISPYYKDAEDVFKALLAFFHAYPDGRLIVDFRVLFENVLSKFPLKSNIATWLEFRLNTTGTLWEIRGTLPLANIIEHAWLHPPRPVTIVLAEPPWPTNEVTAELARLTLHAHTMATIETVAAVEWDAFVSRICRGTAGDGAPGPRFVQVGLPSTLGTAPIANMSSTSLAALLRASADEFSWAALEVAVKDLLLTSNIEPALRTAMLDFWTILHSHLLLSAPKRSLFLRTCLATASEKKSVHFSEDARHGSRAIAPIATSIVFFLSVGAVLRNGTMDVGVRASPEVKANVFMGTLAGHLVALSHSSTFNLDVKSLGRNPYPCLSLESSLLLLGNVTQEPDSLLHFWKLDAHKYSARDDFDLSFSASAPPGPILTSCASYSRALEEGFAALQAHFLTVLQDVTDRQHQSLVRAVALSAFNSLANTSAASYGT